MILEVVILNVRSGTSEAFEAAFREASPIIASMRGYLTHELRPCLESPTRYLLTVRWERLEDHVTGFRQSPEYQRWKALLHHFYEPFPTVEHYGEPLPLGGDSPTSPDSRWQVIRADDNGNQFTVAENLSPAAAQAMVRQFEDLGHKQGYWARPH